MQERHAQNAILDYLTLKGHFFWRNNTAAMRAEHGGFYRFGTPGSPDIIGCVKGRMICIEVKGSRGQLSAAQESFRDRIIEAGGVYVVARSVDDVIACGL